MAFSIAAFADEAGGMIDEQIGAMKENNVTLLEIRTVDGQNIADISPEKAREVRKKLEAHGLAVWSLGSPYGKIGIEGDIDAHIEKMKRGLELAQVLGAKHIRLFSFYVPEDRPGDFEGPVMEAMSRMVRAAEGSGVMLCHENEKGIFGSNAARCLKIHETFPKIRAVFDPANFIQCGQDTKEAWNLLSSFVEYMHIKDALEDGSVVPAGEGIGELPYLLGQYRGQVLTVEPHLTVFPGLEKLEAGEKTKHRYTYASSREAFRVAVEALRKLSEQDREI